MLTILDSKAYDIRFLTSRTMDGSDAMHSDPDYSAVYVILQTDHPDGLEGHSLTITVGRGNEMCVVAIQPSSRMAAMLPLMRLDIASPCTPRRIAAYSYPEGSEWANERR